MTSGLRVAPDERVQRFRESTGRGRVEVKPAVTIVADDRERGSGVVSALGRMEGVSVFTRRLPVGDYRADDRLMFERKTLLDWAASLIDGRLFTQMIRLTQQRLTGVLILEGEGQDLKRSGMRREALQGALISTSLILGIPVLRSKSPPETAGLMVIAARQASAVAGGGLSRPGYRPRSRRGRQLFILQGLPGIGRERARRLLNRFGSVAGVIGADREALEAVDGIGAKTALSIVRAVNEAQAEYGLLEN